MCASPARNADFDPPNLHTAVLTGLVGPLCIEGSLGCRIDPHWAVCTIIANEASAARMMSPHALRLASCAAQVPATRYTYTINGQYTSSFLAPREAGPEESFTFVAYADMGEPWDKAAKSPL